MRNNFESCDDDCSSTYQAFNETPALRPHLFDVSKDVHDSVLFRQLDVGVYRHVHTGATGAVAENLICFVPLSRSRKNCWQSSKLCQSGICIHTCSARWLARLGCRDGDSWRFELASGIQVKRWRRGWNDKATQCSGTRLPCVPLRSVISNANIPYQSLSRPSSVWKNFIHCVFEFLDQYGICDLRPDRFLYCWPFEAE